MRVHTRTEVVWDDDAQQYVQILDEFYEASGPVELCKGPSSDQTNLAKSQAELYDTMSANYKATFGENQQIINNLTTSLQPTLAKGPDQFGYSPAEENALKSQAIEGTADEYTNAEKALRESQAAEGGGNNLLPSGAQEQERQELAAAGARQTSGRLFDIQNSGFAQGHKDYLNATNSLEGVSGLLNPTAAGSSADTSGTNAYSSAKTNQDMANAGSIWNTVGGIIGGAASAAAGNPMGFVTAGKALFGGGGGSSDVAAAG